MGKWARAIAAMEAEPVVTWLIEEAILLRVCVHASDEQFRRVNNIRQRHQAARHAGLAKEG